MTALAARLGLATEEEVARDLLSLASREHPVLVPVRSQTEVASARAALDVDGGEPAYFAELVRAADAIAQV